YLHPFSYRICHYMGFFLHKYICNHYFSTCRFRLYLGYKGITNQLLGCYVGSVGEAGVVLVRVYGKMTELFVDRKREMEMFRLLHAHGCGPRLYCSFQNGICYEFLKGTVLDDPLLTQPAYLFRLLLVRTVSSLLFD
uniref:ethanolamine kinase n=1 Tax=Astyanax mexicanus TaxID=7994 RepID=A0A8B9GU41_ASTMX